MTLQRGSGLLAADANGLSDPYVKLSLRGERRKSRVVRRSLEPVWEQTFEWSGPRAELLHAPLSLEVRGSSSTAAPVAPPARAVHSYVCTLHSLQLCAPLLLLLPLLIRRNAVVGIKYKV